MHHPTDRIAHTMAFVTPVVEHWLEREIAQWVEKVLNASVNRSCLNALFFVFQLAVDCVKMPASVEKDFEFSFASKDLRSTLTVPVTVPLPTSVSEFAGRIVLAHNLPCFVEDGLYTELRL